MSLQKFKYWDILFHKHRYQSFSVLKFHLSILQRKDVSNIIYGMNIEMLNSNIAIDTKGKAKLINDKKEYKINLQNAYIFYLSTQDKNLFSFFCKLILIIF